MVQALCIPERRKIRNFNIRIGKAAWEGLENNRYIFEGGDFYVFLDDCKCKSGKHKEVCILSALVRSNKQRNPSQIGCRGTLGV